MSRSRNLLLAAGIVGTAVVLAVALAQLRPDPEVRPAESQVPFVSTAPARAGDGPIRVHGAGTVRPRAEIEVAAQVAGKVAWVAPAFQSGGRVRRGQLLFRIDAADYQNRVRQARANVAAQQVALLQAAEEARIAREEYEQFARRRGEGGTGTREAGPLALREPQLGAARAALERDSAVLADAELALSRTEVTAPFAGVVRDEAVDVGRLVAAGQPVGRLYAADAVEVVVPLSDADAALIPGLWELRAGDADAGTAARVASGYGDARHVWEGYVDRAEAALDEQTRTIDVVVRIPSPFRADPPLLVGRFVDVEIDGRAPERWFALPRPALRPGAEVWALRNGGRIGIVPVRVLQRTDDTVFVSGALAPGQPVVAGGISFATEGMVVRTTFEGPTAQPALQPESSR